MRGHGFPSSNTKEEVGLRRRRLLSPTSQRAPCRRRFCFRCEPRWVMLQLLLSCNHMETVCGDSTCQCLGFFYNKGLISCYFSMMQSFQSQGWL